MEAAAVVEGGVLEDQATEVRVGSHDVVGLFLLAELVAVVLRLIFGGFTDEARSNQRTVHSTEERATKYTSHTQHVEGVHQDIVLGLEDQPMGPSGLVFPQGLDYIITLGSVGRWTGN